MGHFNARALPRMRALDWVQKSALNACDNYIVKKRSLQITKIFYLIKII